MFNNLNQFVDEIRLEQEMNDKRRQAMRDIIPDDVVDKRLSWIPFLDIFRRNSP